MASTVAQAGNWLSDKERANAHTELEEITITSGNIKDYEAVIFYYYKYEIHYAFEVGYQFGLCPCFDCVYKRKNNPLVADDPFRLNQ